MTRARTLAIPVLAALMAAGAGAAPAAAAKVRQMVVFRDAHALTKRVSTDATKVTVAGRRCAVAGRTPLAALVRSNPGRIRLRDFGACSSRPSDAAGLLVTGIDGDRNRGQRGWVYKVGHRAATAGAADPSGPFGHGRLRAGQRVTWFYCVRAADCQRTLEPFARRRSTAASSRACSATTTPVTACRSRALRVAPAGSARDRRRTAARSSRSRRAPTASSHARPASCARSRERVAVP